MDGTRVLLTIGGSLFVVLGGVLGFMFVGLSLAFGAPDLPTDLLTIALLLFFVVAVLTGAGMIYFGVRSSKHAA